MNKSSNVYAMIRTILVAFVVAGATSANAMPPPFAPPIAVNDDYEVVKNTVLTVSAADGLLSNDIIDPSCAQVEIVLNSLPQNGQLILNADGSFTYTPNADWEGTDQFGYYLSACFLNSAPATVTIVVTGDAPPLVPPVAVDDEYEVVKNTVLTVSAADGLLSNDAIDPSCDEVEIVLNSNPQNGQLILNADGSFTYTPNADWEGTDQFGYQLRACGVWSDGATVRIVVTGDPDPVLTVVSGTGSGTYTAGTSVDVTADAAPAGQLFSHWTVEPADAFLGETFDADSASTTVIMPDHDVTLTAQWEAIIFTILPGSRAHSSAAYSDQQIGVLANLPWTAVANHEWITITGGLPVRVMERCHTVLRRTMETLRAVARSPLQRKRWA